MNITRLALQKDRIAWVVLIVILAAGVMAYLEMPRAEDPGFPIRWALVVTYFPGASPQRVEKLVTDKVEKAIQEMPELESIRTESRTGVSIVHVEVKPIYGEDELRPIWDKLRRRVDEAKRQLPQGVFGPYVNDEFGDVFGIVMTITGEGFSYAELKEVADDVRDELLMIEDVAKVEIYGSQEERVFVEFDNERLAALNIPPLLLKQLLDSTNILIPGGDIRVGDERILLEPSGNLESIEDLARTVLHIPGRSEVVYLEDIATVSRGYIDPPRTMMRFMGQPCLGLAVSMREGGNIMRLGAAVREVQKRLERIYPIGLEFDFAAFQPDRVDFIVTTLNRNLFQALVIIVLVMLAALGLRGGLVVVSTIPMSIIMTFMFMAIFNLGMDQIAIAAIIIALGMLVDNAICTSELIMVQVAEGKKPFDAAVHAARELALPLLTASLITCVAFLPIALAKSETGEYCRPLFWVVSICLLSSWLLALTLTPLLCVRFLKVRRRPEGGLYNTWFYKFYRAFLLLLLRRPFVTVALAAIAFAVAMTGFQHLPVIFFPSSDRPTFTVEIEMPNGTAIERVEEVVTQFEGFLAADPEVAPYIVNWASFIGESGPRFVLTYALAFSRPEYAVVLVNVTDYEVVDKLMAPIEHFCRENFPDAKLTIKPISLSPPSESPIEVRISGKDPEVLFDLVDEVKAKLASIPGARNIDDDWGIWTKKLVVNVDQPRARRAGVSSQEIALSLMTALSGFEIAQFREEDKLIPITLRSVAADRQDMSKLEALNVFSQLTGQSVPLKQVADIEVEWEPAKIMRRNRLRTITVSSSMAPGVTAHEVISQIVPWLEHEERNWVLGYRWELGGEAEDSAEANEAIIHQLPRAMLIILLLLIIEFNSIRRTFITLLTIPLGMIGVAVGLLAANLYIGFMTILGIVSLAGIVTKNAIVLIERIDVEIRHNGLEPPRAIVEAAQRRMRPILLTSVTTIFGLLPLWVNSTPMWPPMAVSIIFGLLFATLLTLGIVPALYALLFRVKFKGFKY